MRGLTERTEPADVPTRALGADDRRSVGRVSAWVLVALLCATAGVALSAYPNDDPDIYWHRVLGGFWLEHWSLATNPDPISYTPGNDWRPSAWLAEVGYALAVSAAGYDMLHAFRLFLAVLFFALLTRYALRALDARSAVVILACAGLPASLVIQDRPQTISVVLVAAMLPAVHRAYAQDALPRWWAAVLLTWFWANLHGLWILVPGLLILLAAARALERKRSWWQPLWVAAASTAAAALTPVGPKLLLTPLAVQGATGHISEWSPTTLRAPVSWGLAVFLVLLLARLPRRDRRTVLYVVALLVFAFWAHRNVVFATLLLSPLVVESLRRSDGAYVGPTVRRRLVIAAVPLLGLAAASSYVLHAGTPDRLPMQIAGVLAEREGRTRVLTEYNVSGFIREFGRHDVRVSIDGRTDRYGAERIRRHGEMIDGLRGWRSTFRQLRPDAVVIDRRRALRELLEQDGWRLELRDKDYVLLLPDR